MHEKRLILYFVIIIICILCISIYYSNNRIEYFSSNNIIYCFWTGYNEMSKNRRECLEQLKSASQCRVILITPDNLNDYILPNAPLHKSYPYLSETHKADYLRTYFMHFHGGGYSDIKKTTASWVSAFDDIRSNSDCYINGYREQGPGDIAYAPNAKHWQVLLGNGAYICRPQTEFTAKWYNEMIQLLDSKLETLKKHPATYPQENAEDGNGYPLEWNELLGRIFHKLLMNYLPNLMYTLPRPICIDYR
jgi:Capsular polysaccharide synthesis protein